MDNFESIRLWSHCCGIIALIYFHEWWRPLLAISSARNSRYYNLDDLLFEILETSHVRRSVLNDHTW